MCQPSSFLPIFPEKNNAGRLLLFLCICNLELLTIRNALEETVPAAPVV